MVNPPQFKSLEEMDASKWLATIKSSDNPKECIRCQQTESVNGTSLRLNAIEFDQQQTTPDYLIVGGVLDNVCNSACLTCNEQLSTKIGSLKSKNYPIVNNSNTFWSLPLDRVVHLDINGGEPSASKNYKYILANLPNNITSIRLNTNCSTVLTELDQLITRGIKVTVTVSLDGIGEIHDRVRWPIKWDLFYKNLMLYKGMGLYELNTWTTVSALNIGDLKNIFSYVQQHNLKNSWALLENPSVLSVKHNNHLTRTSNVPDELKSIVATGHDNTVELQLHIANQDRLRGITRWDYYR
jgi:sulfatase maturation enzyme AslB (radical SAM superfamily)